MHRRYAAYAAVAFFMLGSTIWFANRDLKRSQELRGFLGERLLLYSAFQQTRELPYPFIDRFSNSRTFKPQHQERPFPPDNHVLIAAGRGRNYQHSKSINAMFHVDLDAEACRKDEALRSQPPEELGVELLNALLEPLPDAYDTGPAEISRHPTESPHFGDMIVIDQIARSATGHTALQLQVRLSSKLIHCGVSARVHEGLPAISLPIDAIPVSMPKFTPASTLSE